MSAAKNLQGCIVRLRKTLGEGAITTTANGYVLTVPPDEIDSERFERMVTRGRELLALGEADRAAFVFDRRAGPLAGRGVRRPRGMATVRVGRTAARRAAPRGRGATGRRPPPRRAVRRGACRVAGLVREAPLRERRWTLLALAHYQAGNQAEALRVLHQLKSVLLQQLGIDPGPDVVALEQAILRQDTSLVAAAATGAAGRPAPTSDSSRTTSTTPTSTSDATTTLTHAWRSSRPIGCWPWSARAAPGSRACSGPAWPPPFGTGGQATVTITPGPHPMAALAVLGTSPRARRCWSTSSRSSSACLTTRTSVRRSCRPADDRGSAAARAAGHPRRLPRRHHRLRRPQPRSSSTVSTWSEPWTTTGCNRPSSRPARLAGLVIEPGLVDLLVREVADDPGALPLLSHALLETWRRREGNTLTVAAYRASGGIHGAVAQSAERLYAEVGLGASPAASRPDAATRRAGAARSTGPQSGAPTDGRAPTPSTSG